MTTPIYTDWQNQQGFEGTGKLIRKVGNGLPFLFEDSVPEKQLKYYYCERWLVELDGVVLQRCLLKRVRGRKPVEKEVMPSVPKIEDEYIIFNGKPVF